MNQELTAEEKLKFLEKQVRERCAGIRRAAIRCPYCNKENNPQAPLCCDLFESAVTTILDRIDQEKVDEHFQRIGESLNSNNRRN